MLGLQLYHPLQQLDGRFVVLILQCLHRRVEQLICRPTVGSADAARSGRLIV